MLRAALVLLSVSLSSITATAEEFRAVLEPNLVPESGFAVVLERMPEPPVDLRIPDDAGVFSGLLLPMGQWRFRVLLVEPRSGSPFIYIDIDRNGVFGAGERFSFTATRNRFGRQRIRVALSPTAGSLFGHIPLELLLADHRLALRRSPDERYLLHSVLLYATAKVRIDGRSYLFRYAVKPDTGTIDLPNGLHLLDEGRLTRDVLSPWRAWGRGAPPVFRIGNRYVATRKVDAMSRTVVIETRDADDYKRLELYPGLTVPDFPFQDIEGHTHHLADFRGRFVLLNVWYPGCGPCVDQFPFLRAAADRFGNDLLIVGFSQGYPRAGSLRDVSPASPPAWIEAEPRSVQHLMDEWLQITSTPTSILLDREGRVLVLERWGPDNRPLSGDELLRTLERVIRRGRRRASS
jgi:thiol-disulfide isomerase/thioredoxin